MSIKLLCDTLCDIPDEITNKEYVDVVPLTVIFPDMEYKETIDITKEEFYRIVKEKDCIPKTSQATYMDFKTRYDKYVEEGYDIICITGAAKSSGTFQSACIAKADMEKGNIEVFDTNNLSLGSGQYVIKACELIEQGKGLQEICAELNELHKSTILLFMPYTLKYLKASGRVPVAAAILGNMLNIKPILHFDNGEGKLISTTRGNKQMASKLVDVMLDMCKGRNISDLIVTIGCGDNMKEVKKLEEEVKNRIKCKKIFFARGGAAICSHTGPDILALSCSY
ncbi:MAG: DegV family protein [Clostridioides sp.]|nr:DegV family protein [Clostridioides sp.]